ncbi:MAG TPA: hypothetical protein VIV11_37830 [Kofleriaceae bacterium]
MRVFVVAIVVALQLPAHADPAEDAALLHLDRGIAAFNAKDFSTAEREFAAAHQLVPDKANPYRWLALSEIQLGNCKSAVGHIDGFIARVPPADTRVAEMTRWREFCRRELAQPAQSPQLTGTQALAQPSPPEDTQLRQRWWFWPVIGVAALTITGVTVYAVTRGDEATMLPPIRCDATGCR